MLTVLKVLVCLNSARMPLRLISVCQEIISSFLSHRSIFPRFNNVPVRKLKICCSLKTYFHSGKWIYSQSRKSQKFSCRFPQNNQQRRNAPIQWSRTIRESNFLVKGYGKHQQSLVKSPAKSWNFTDQKEYKSFCFLVPQSVRKNFDPTFVATLQGSSLNTWFPKGQIQESSWESGWIFTSLSQWNSVYLNCLGKRKTARDTGEFEWAV